MMLHCMYAKVLHSLEIYTKRIFCSCGILLILKKMEQAFWLQSWRWAASVSQTWHSQIQGCAASSLLDHTWLGEFSCVFIHWEQRVSRRY